MKSNYTNDTITLNVYDTDMVTVKKTSTANMVKLPFGIIRKLMCLFDLESIEDTSEVLKVVTSSWSSVIALLENVFPDISEEDWDNVDTGELVLVLIAILKAKFSDILKVPTNSKN